MFMNIYVWSDIFDGGSQAITPPLYLKNYDGLRDCKLFHESNVRQEEMDNVPGDFCEEILWVLSLTRRKEGT